MSLAKFEKFSFLLGLTSLLLFLFLPLLIIDFYHISIADHSSTGAEEATVGITVVARATTRRVLGPAMTSVFRTTFASFSRAAGRTFIRRVIRFTVYTLLGALSILTASRNRLAATPNEKATHPLLGIALGVAALALSFYGVLVVAGPETTTAITSNGVLSHFMAAMIAGIPLAFYCAMHLVMAKVLSFKLRINTAIDALLLQAYFTCSGVFVPMTTDIEYLGNLEENRRAAMISLISMFAIHLVLKWSGIWFDSVGLELASNMFLIYCFVYAFPIPPLEGYDVWRHSKILWLCIFLPILVAFLSLPESLAGLFGIVATGEIAS